MADPVTVVDQHRVQRSMFAILHGDGVQQPMIGHLLQIRGDAGHIVGRGESLQRLNMMPDIVLDLPRFVDAFVHMLQLQGLHGFVMFAFAGFAQSVRLLDHIPDEEVGHGHETGICDGYGEGDAKHAGVEQRCVVGGHAPHHNCCGNERKKPDDPPKFLLMEGESNVAENE